MILAYQTTNNAYQGAGVFAYEESAVEVPVPAKVQTPAGYKRLPQERYLLQIEGETFVFYGLADLVDYLESRKVELEKKAEKKAERQAKRILSTGKVVTPKPYRVALPEAVISAQPRIAEILRDIEQAYTDALQAVFAREAEDDEDLAVIASFL